MSTNEQDILARIQARRAAASGGDLQSRIAGRRRAALESAIFTDGNPSQQPKATEAPETFGGYMKNYLRTVATGVPFSDEIEGAVSAIPSLMPGGETPGESFARNTDEARAGREDFSKEHPRMAGVGRLAGIIGGTVASAPLLTARPIMGAAALGAAYGAGDAEGGLENRAIGGVVGGALGGATAGLLKAAPPVVKSLLKPTRAAVVGAGVEGVRSLADDRPGAVDMAADMARGAAYAGGGAMLGRKLAGSISERLAQRMANEGIRDAAAGVTSATAREAQQMAGTGRAADVRLMDLNDNLLGLARGAMGVSGSTAREELPALAQARGAGRLGRSIGDVEEAVGVPAGKSPQLLKGLKQARSTEASKSYEIARNLPDVNDRGVFDLLSSDPMRPFVNDARSQWAREEAGKIATGGKPEPFNALSVRAIDLVKRSLDDEISVSQRAGRGNAVRQLQGLKQSLLEPVDAARPEYKAARDAFADASGPIDAIRKARGGVKGVKSFTKSTPEEVNNALSGMDEMGQTMYKLGAIDDLKQSLGKAGNMQGHILGKFGPDSPEWQKLRLIVGSDDVMDRLTGRQNMESAFEKAANQLQPERGSRTFFGNMDVSSFRDWSNLARQALEELMPTLSTSRAVANKVGETMQLGGDDLVRYLETLEQQARMDLARKGRWDLISATTGVAASAVGAPRLAGPSRGKER